MNLNNWDYCYHSPYGAEVCISRIAALPWEYICDLGTPLWYECERVSDTSILLIFTGGQFRKAKRTQYLLEFTGQKDGTQVRMRFVKDLFCMSPLTPATDIDQFMLQKIGAERVPL